MIYHVTGWSDKKQYADKRLITIVKLVKPAWLTRYPRPIEILYDQGSEFISHDFIKYIIETEYRINAKPSILGNTTSNAILEQIHQVLGNLVRNFNIIQT